MGHRVSVDEEKLHNLLHLGLHFIRHAFVTGSAKTRHNREFFSNSCLLNIYNLLSQVYALEKFQPHMPLTFRVTANKVATTERLICTASVKKINCRHLLKQL